MYKILGSPLFHTLCGEGLYLAVQDGAEPHNLMVMRLASIKSDRADTVQSQRPLEAGCISINGSCLVSRMSASEVSTNEAPPPQKYRSDNPQSIYGTSF